MKIPFNLFLMLFIISVVDYGICQEIQVTIKGVDDGIKSSKQQDYKEAVMNAKLEAIERAGSEIQSITKITNFQLKYNSVESTAEGVLLPGYDIIDIGYQKDGNYLIILSAILRVGNESLSPSKLYYKSLTQIRQEQVGEAIKNLQTIINNHQDSEYAIKAYATIDEIKELIFNQWDRIRGVSDLKSGTARLEHFKKLINNGYDPRYSYLPFGMSVWYLITAMNEKYWNDSQMAEAAIILIKNGFDVNNWRFGDPLSGPLHRAAEYDYILLAKTLLDAGIHVNSLDYHNETPLKRAKSNKMRSLLIKYGAK